jgi:hypothetical protein
MRDMGVHGVFVYCAEYRCGHSVALNADCWPDEVRLSDIEPFFAPTTSRSSRGIDFLASIQATAP